MSVIGSFQTTTFQGGARRVSVSVRSRTPGSVIGLQDTRPAPGHDVKQLIDLGLVKSKPKRKSVELTTTKRFIETFGIDARSRHEVKAWLEDQLTKMTGKKPA